MSLPAARRATFATTNAATTWVAVSAGWSKCRGAQCTPGGRALPFSHRIGDIGAMVAPPKQSTVLDSRAFDRALRRMAEEIGELNNGTEGLVIVGIQRRGVQLAAQIVSNIGEREKAEVPQGALDITL